MEKDHLKDHTYLMAAMAGLIVEDEVLTNSLLMQVLSANPEFRMQSAKSVASAMSLARKTSFDFAILDLNLGLGPSGLDLAWKLRELFPQIGLALLTSFADLRFHTTNPRIPLGVRVLYKANQNHLNGIREICIEICRSPLRADLRTTRFAGLTDEQIELWRLTASGLSNSELASHFEISAKAIEKRLHFLYKVLEINLDNGRSGRIELVRLYFQLTSQVPNA